VNLFKNVFLPAAFVFFFYPLRITACTTFVLKTADTVLLAKNLDWPIGDGIIVTNKKGAVKSAFSLNDSSFQWQARYSSITFNQFGKEFPLGGINEMGLVIEEMNYVLSEFPRTGQKNLNEFQWIQYNLDNYASVAEVINNIDTVSIVPLFAKLHYMLCDRQGNVAIIEFLQGKVVCYKDKEVVVPVLTNNSYQNSIKYLRNHKGFGGSRVVTYGPESPERFVRAATLLQKAQGNPEKQPHSKAFSILQSVEQQDTQWSIVYDISNAAIYFKTRHIPNEQKIVLSDFDYGNRNEVFVLPEKDMENQTLKFEDYQPQVSYNQIQSVLEKLVALEEYSKDDAGHLLRTFEVYYQSSK